MKITAVENGRLGEFSNLVWVRLRTDEGVTVLGETFMGAAAVGAAVLLNTSSDCTSRRTSAASALLASNPAGWICAFGGRIGSMGWSWPCGQIWAT